MHALMALSASSPAMQQQGGISAWVWIILILIVVVLLLWWLGRQEERGSGRDESIAAPPSAKTETFETPLLTNRGGEIPSPMTLPVVEQPPAAAEPLETKTVQVFEPPADLVVDQQEAQATVEAEEEAPTTGAFEFAPTDAPPAEPVPGPVEGFPDMGVDKPGPAQLDDLEIIEGIGPKIASVLRAAGVDTFTQLAGMQPVEITKILHDAGLRLADPTTWPEQARLAMEGKWDEFKAFTDSLRGGRKAG